MYIWIRDTILVIGFLIFIGMIGCSEKLPDSAEKKLELAREGVPDSELNNY